MAYAQTSDVQARLGRPLTVDEGLQADAFLEDAEILIKARIPDLDDKVADGDIAEASVIMVESNAVVRLLRNPDGFIGESDGNYSYQKNGKLATGALEILEHEWSLLGCGSGVFLINLKVKTPFEYATYTPADPQFYYDPMFWN
jgi:hypothetical protein